jgi:hypothetical protein
MAARPLDTSTLGPIRVPLPGDRTPRQRARELFAERIAAQGPAWRNAADSVLSGYSNVWIDAAIAAIEPLVRQLRAEEDGD